MPEVKFTVAADMASALQGFVKLVQSQKKAEDGFGGVVRAGDRGMKMLGKTVDELRTKLTRMEQDAVRSAARMSVAATRNRTQGGANLTIDRSAIRAVAGGQASMLPGMADVQRRRNELARQIRDDRSFDRFIRAQNESAAAMKIANKDFSTMMAKHQARLTAAIQRGADREQLQKDLDMDLHQHKWAVIHQRREQRAAMWRGVGVAGLAVGAAANAYGQRVMAELDDQAQKTIAFENVMVPLYGVGDNNTRRGELRKEVLSAAIQLGVDPGEAAAVRFNLQSRAADRSPGELNAIVKAAEDFYRLQRANMSQTAPAIDAMARLLRDELPAGEAGIRSVRNKLGYAADVGSFEIAEIAPYLGEIMGAGKAMGYSGNEMLAATIVASQAGKRPEGFATAVRNVALLGPEAEQKLGVKLTDMPLGQALGNLSKVDSKLFAEAFGRDNASTVKFLVDNADAISKHTGTLKGTSEATDTLTTRLNQASLSLDGMRAAILASSQTIQNNATIVAGGKAGRGAMIEGHSVRKAGAEMIGADPLLAPFKVPLTYIDELDSRATGGRLTAAFDMPRAIKNLLFGGGSEEFKSNAKDIIFGGSKLQREGVREMIKAAQDAGDTARVAYLRLTYNPDNDMRLMNKLNWTNGPNTQLGDKFLRFRRQYEDLDEFEFIHYLNLFDSGDKNAQSYLNSVGRKPGKTAKTSASAGSLSSAADSLHNAVAKMDIVADKMLRSYNQHSTGSPHV